MKTKVLVNNLRLGLFTLFLLIFSVKGFSQACTGNQITVNIQNVTNPTTTTVEFDVYINNTGTTAMKLSGFTGNVRYPNNGWAAAATLTAVILPAATGNFPTLSGFPTLSNTPATGQLRWTNTPFASEPNSVNLPPNTNLMFCRLRLTNPVAWAPSTAGNLYLSTGGAGISNITGTVYCSGNTNSTSIALASSTLILGSPANFLINGNTCFTSGTYTQTPVTCFGDASGTATITMSPTPSSLDATYILDGTSPTPVTLTAGGAFTLIGLAAGPHTLSVTGNGSCTTAVDVPFVIGGPAGPLTNTTTITACGSYTWSVTGATYTSSGTQTGTTINGSGCTVNETLNLTIEPAPVTTPYSICQGGTVSGGLVSTLGGGASPVPNYSGDNTGGPTYNRATEMNQGGTCANSGAGTAVQYRTHSFVAPASGAYTFSTCGGAAFDTFLALYQDPFNPAGLCAGNTLIESGDDNCGTQSTVTVTLVQGTAYTLVLSGFANVDAGPYTITSTSPVAPSVEWYTTPTLGSSIGTGSPFNPVGVAGSGITDTNTVGATTFYAQFPGSTCRTPAIFTVSPTIPTTTTITACATYTWPVNGTTYTTGGTYTSVTGCTTETLNLTITTPVAPTFTQVAAICNGATLTALPTTSNNAITGTWAPALNNTATTTYTFTPTAGQCAINATMTITVNPIVTPTFTQVAAICSGATLTALPTTSNNAITGTWAPAINNTTTTTYTFTPTAGQCGTTATMTIIVNPNATPTFTQVTPKCSGATLTALPTTSNNGITGTWAPALNNTATTTYTFTPTAGQCAINATMTITINPNVTPTFTQVTPKCSGATLTALPTTSNNAITGTWAPALNNTATTTYTFTPTAGLCATTATMTITINPNVTPTFTQVAAICSGATLTALPTTSNNAITGTWAPALNNTATTTYTFTPTAGLCATTATMTITVNPNVTPTFTQVAAICNGATLTALPTTSNNTITGTWAPALNNTATTTYTFTPTAGQCATTATMTITVNTTPAPTGNATQSFSVVNLNNATIANLVVSPAGVLWYATLANAQTGTNPLASTTVITNGSTYWAVNVVGGCRSTPFAVTVTVTLGNEEFDNLNFSFYPNPTSSILNISYSRVISDVLVFNMLGQEVMKKKTNDSDVQIDLSPLAEATYFVKVTSEGRDKIIKVIKRN